MTENQFDKAIPYFQRSLLMDQSNGQTNYNLAYCYLMFDNRDTALIYAKKALDLFSDTLHRASTLSLIGATYEELNKSEEALKYLIQANTLKNGDENTLFSLLTVYLKTYRSEDAINTADKIFFNNVSDTAIISRIIDTYLLWKKDKELERFDAEISRLYKNNNRVLGEFNFVLAEGYDKFEIRKIAKEKFLAARKYFLKLGDSHQPYILLIDEKLMAL